MSRARRRASLPLGANALAVVGAIMLLVGAQMPALEVQLRGELSYLDIGGAPGSVLIAAAVGVLIAVVIQSRAALKLCAVAVWVALLWPMLRAGYERIVPPERGALDELGSALGQAVGDAVGGNLLEIIGVRAGAFVLLGGCVLVSAGAWRTSARR